MIPETRKEFGFAGKIALLVCSMVLFTTISVGSLITYKFSDIMHDREDEALEREAQFEGKRYTLLVQSLRNHIFTISGVPPIQGIIRARKSDGIDPFDNSSEEEWRNRLEQIFSQMLTIMPEYRQVHFIGLEDGGREIVRVDRHGNQIRIVSDDELQRKGHREYFTETIGLSPGTIYLSDIALHRENSNVVEPHMPMLRAATTVHDADGNLYGIVIINLDVGYFFKDLLGDAPKHQKYYIANENGDFLLHDDPARAFGFEFGKPYRISEAFPELMKDFQEASRSGSIHLYSHGHRDQNLGGILKVHYDPDTPERYITFLVTKHSEVIMAAWIQTRNEVILFSLGLLGAALIVGMLFSRTITTPLRRIAGAVEEFGRGVGDVTLPVEARGEAGTLARSFAEMIQRVEDRTDQLEVEIGERSRIEHKLKYEVSHDSLTDLPNRASLVEALERCLEAARDNSACRFAVMFLDLDRFKVVNDSLGHVIGDNLLIEVARRLRSCLRMTDTVSREDSTYSQVARLGGDEFVILLDCVSEISYTQQIAQRIQQSIGEPFEIDGHEIFTSVSIGITMSEARYISPEEMLRDADTALYKAKADGKACHRVFDQEMHETITYQMKLENDLRRAVEKKQFELLYQPIVSLCSGTIAGFEALIRWRHPLLGTLMPAEFIPLAEETNMIASIGQWVLREACEQVRRWEKDFGIAEGACVSVNISESQLMDNDLVGELNDLLIETGIQPSQLWLEVTEKSIMRDVEKIIEVMHGIKKLGLELHIDDFGTGHSTLNCLHQYPIDVIKIDRSFLMRLDEGVDYTAMLQAIVTLAHNLKMKVLIEGVETSNQAAQILAMECDYAQGFLFAKPITATEASSMLRKTQKWNFAA